MPIKPFVINFAQVNGQPINDKWRDHVCWYGDHPFGSALWRLLTVKSVRAEIEFLPEIIIHNEEQRREIAAVIQKQVEAKFRSK